MSRKWTILFVCTGNTCRSPMASAIARHLLSAGTPNGKGVDMVVASAGTMAAPGAPATPEAVAALRDLGIEMGEHESRELTPALIGDADMVFTMSPAHSRYVRSLDPSSASKVRTLDPSGADIPDPIGGAPEVYARSAARLRELVEAQFTKLGLIGPARARVAQAPRSPKP